MYMEGAFSLKDENLHFTPFMFLIHPSTDAARAPPPVSGFAYQFEEKHLSILTTAKHSYIQ